MMILDEGIAQPTRRTWLVKWSSQFTQSCSMFSSSFGITGRVIMFLRNPTERHSDPLEPRLQGPANVLSFRVLDDASRLAMRGVNVSSVVEPEWRNWQT